MQLRQGGSQGRAKRKLIKQGKKAKMQKSVDNTIFIIIFISTPDFCPPTYPSLSVPLLPLNGCHCTNTIYLVLQAQHFFEPSLSLLSFISHIPIYQQILSHYTHSISQIWPFLTTSTSTTLITIIFFFHQDCYNSLLIGIPYLCSCPLTCFLVPPSSQNDPSHHIWFKTPHHWF